MTLEIEAKIRVDSLEPVAERLASLGARHIADLAQNDAYFFDAEGKLVKSGCGLRLRSETTAGQTVSILTFKGTRQKGAYKIRPEYETPIENADAMLKILEGLGYHSRLIVNKSRRLWEMDGCEVCLDNVPPLGSFVEVEGESETVIQHTLSRLGLADRPHITESYAAMMAQQENIKH